MTRPESDAVIRAEAAHMTARAAWLYPDDHEQRAAAVIACDAINVNYLEVVASVMESTGAGADLARRLVAEALRKTADETWAEALATNETEKR